VGQSIDCVVLDIDTEKKIVDLSERLTVTTSKVDATETKKNKKEF
jgi:translation initiation factor 2 alpha subunit (eIF-2alpha)